MQASGAAGSYSTSSSGNPGAGVDRKRISGPAVSLQPLPPLEEAESSTGLAAARVLSDTNRRLDGRTPESIRPLFMTTGVVVSANGSAFIEAGKIKIVAAVYGPRTERKQTTTERGRLFVDFRFAPFAHEKFTSYIRSNDEKHFSTLLANALTPAVVLEAFPKAAIEIYVTILEADGTAAALALSVTAASLALANAGIEMLDLVTGSSAAFGAAAAGVPLMDPTKKEESRLGAVIFVARMPSINQITQFMQRGEMNNDTAAEIIDQCIDCTGEIHAAVRKCLLEDASKGSKKKMFG